MAAGADAQFMRATMTAAAQGNIDAIRKASDTLRKMKMPKDLDGKTPLHAAASEGQLEIVRYLLALGLDVNAADKDGWTSLHCAASRGHFAVCDALLSKGADVRALTNQGTTVLHYAVRTNLNDAFLFLSVLQTLIEKKADVDACNQYGETPLHQACFRGNDLAVVWLIMQQADMNHADRKKLMPLHLACMVGHRSTAEILLSQGADVAAKSDSGTPLELAILSKNEALVEIIKEALNGVGAAKRMRSYSEIETIVKTFADGKATGQTRFLGDLQYLVVKLGQHFKILRLDLTDPVNTWFPYFAYKFNISDIDEYVLAINPVGASTFVIDPAQSVVTAFGARDANEVPPDTLYELKRRKRIFDLQQGTLNKACESLDINEFDKIAKPLVVLFQASGKAQVLLTWAIGRDLERTENATGLFREDSLSTKMITNYLRVMGTSYLNRTLGSHIRSMIAAGTTYEVDPVRPDWKKGNKKKLQELVEKFLQSILQSRNHCPSQILTLCAEISEVTSSKFPDCKQTAVGSFIFLRFICPAITSPANYGLLEESPPPQVLRGLVLVAKVIQNTVNGVMFSEKEAYMLKLNKVIEKAIPEVSRFLEQISQRSLNMSAQPVVVKISDIQENEAATRLDFVLQSGQLLASRSGGSVPPQSLHTP